MTKLTRSDGDHLIQVMPLRKGKVNITTGVFTGITLIHCIVDGSFTITWNDATTSVIPMVENRVYSLAEDVKSISISTGTYNLV